MLHWVIIYISNGSEFHWVIYPFELRTKQLTQEKFVRIMCTAFLSRNLMYVGISLLMTLIFIVYACVTDTACIQAFSPISHSNTVYSYTLTERRRQVWNAGLMPGHAYPLDLSGTHVIFVCHVFITQSVYGWRQETKLEVEHSVTIGMPFHSWVTNSWGNQMVVGREVSLPW